MNIFLKIKYVMKTRLTSSLLEKKQLCKQYLIYIRVAFLVLNQNSEFNISL